jgi:hypothetical protein
MGSWRLEGTKIVVSNEYIITIRLTVLRKIDLQWVTWELNRLRSELLGVLKFSQQQGDSEVKVPTTHKTYHKNPNVGQLQFARKS